MDGIEASIESVRRRIGSGQAALYRDMVAVLLEAPARDAGVLRALLLDVLCGEFDPLRTSHAGGAVAALRAAIEAADVTAATRMLLMTVAAQLAAGDYHAGDDVEHWIRRVQLAHATPQPSAVPRPAAVARPPYGGGLSPRLSEVYEAAARRIRAGEPPTLAELAAATGRRRADVHAAVSSLIALGLMVDAGGQRGLDLGDPRVG